MEKTEFVLFRHGETADNQAGILQGHRNTALNDLGRRQAQMAADRLKGGNFDAVFASDLLRAFETAQIIGEAVGLTPVPEKRLREWHLGELEGQYSKELWKSHFEIMNFFADGKGDIAVPGGESRYTFEKRVADCMEEIADKCEGKSVIIVTHTGVLHAIFKHIAGPLAAGNFQPVCSNMAYNRITRVAKGKWRLHCWNDVSHLTEFRNSVTF